ncbi:MAG TPA: hypothetical protein VM783_07805 [Candidatus Acidoferrum sp.]|nr:hypothetical protein [Candidatus Acidoferrum sp.]
MATKPPMHIFYGHQYLGNETNMDKHKKIPDGAYVLIGDKWYHMFHSTLAPMNKVDIPKEVQVQLLILGIQS